MGKTDEDGAVAVVLDPEVVAAGEAFDCFCEVEETASVASLRSGASVMVTSGAVAEWSSMLTSV